MKLNRERLVQIVGLAALIYVFIGVAVTNVADAETSGEESEVAESNPESATVRSTARIWGKTRMDTAIQISREAWDKGEPRDVFIARLDDFPDALSGSSLSSGPILLVPSSLPLPSDPKGPSFPSAVRKEIQRLAPEQVIGLGGKEAVQPHVLEEAANAAGVEPTRLAGPDRFSTAVKVAEYGYPSQQFENISVDTVYLATGEDFPDALAAGSLSDGPVLLVPSDGSLPSPVRDYLDREDPNDVVALGGSAAVSGSMLGQAADAAGDADMSRLGGDDRLETAIAISNHAFEESERVYVTRADDYPDALAGSTLTEGPILLTHTDELPDKVAREVNRLNPDEVVALGGTSAISDSVLMKAATQE